MAIQDVRLVENELMHFWS